jgi:hypothetical protein
MTRFIPQVLAKEVPEDFPYRIALFTRDTHYVIEISRYDIVLVEEDDFPFIILCWGLVSITSENGRKVRYKSWCYHIHLQEFNKTLIEVSALPKKKNSAIKISSKIYRTSEVFRFFPSLDKLNRASKNKLLGNENVKLPQSKADN